MGHPPRQGGELTASTFTRAAELEAAGRPFAVATVVAVRKPTSARPGSSGIIHPDGSIEGWVGGSCAQPVVVREALRALGDGQPRLLRPHHGGLDEGLPGAGQLGGGVGNGHQIGGVGRPCMASHTRAGVHGMSMCVTPKGASASTTALTTAGGEPTVADSPMPFAPIGWCGDGVTV